MANSSECWVVAKNSAEVRWQSKSHSGAVHIASIPNRKGRQLAYSLLLYLLERVMFSVINGIAKRKGKDRGCKREKKTRHHGIKAAPAKK